MCVRYLHNADCVHFTFDVQSTGFDTGSLDPTQFKELFRRNFGVLLNPKDLGILVRLKRLS